MFTNVFLANQPMSQLWLIYRLSLDPIDGSPFGHIMKFRQSSFPFYLLGLNTVSKLVWFFLGGGGGGWCYMYLNYFASSSKSSVVLWLA